MADERNQDCISESHLSSEKLAAMPFPEGGLLWLQTRRDRISPKTFHEYELNLKTLTAFFGEMRLGEITADQIRAYQRMRMTQCGPFAINHECSVIQQMLKRSGRWAGIEADYEPLRLPKEARGRALSEEECERLFRTAASNPNWQAAHLFARISINTSAGPKEVSTLRLKDVDLEKRTMHVQAEGAKNPHRVRVLPLNDAAFEAVSHAVQRAKLLGATRPDHYLFPFRVHRSKFDPTRRQTTFKTAWKRLLKAAQIQQFRLYDLRHHAITVLLENPEISDDTAEQIAGHISRQMKRRYSHIRLEVMRKAVNAMQVAQGVPEVDLRNQDVLDLLEAGISAEIVAAKIKSSCCAFDTSAKALKDLKASNVVDTVILAMVRASTK